MLSIRIIIQDYEDRNKAAINPQEYPGMSKNNFYVGEMLQFTILERGMTSGAASIGLLLQDSEGRYIHCETSAAIFETMAIALKGAQDRFADKRAKKN